MAASSGEPPVSKGKRIDIIHNILNQGDSEVGPLPKQATSEPIELPHDPIPEPIELPKDATPEPTQLPKETTPDPSDHEDTSPAVKKSKKKTKKQSSVNASPTQRKTIQSPNPTAKVIFFSVIVHELYE